MPSPSRDQTPHSTASALQLPPQPATLADKLKALGREPIFQDIAELQPTIVEVIAPHITSGGALEGIRCIAGLMRDPSSPLGIVIQITIDPDAASSIEPRWPREIGGIPVSYAFERIVPAVNSL